jgi:hypothetical protein
MKSIFMNTKKITRCSLIIMLFFTFSSCEQDSIDYTEQISEDQMLKKKSSKSVDIYTGHLNFIAPDQLKSGWTTFNYHNNTNVPHFFTLERMPDGKDVHNWANELLPPFQDAMDAIILGDYPTAFEAFGRFPAWSAAIEFNGGPGIINPGKVATTTVNLSPGTYVIECYIKTPSGKFHASLGMYDQIIVTGSDNGNEEPTADFNINISSTEGIKIMDEIKPGNRRMAVNFLDQAVYGNFVGHDVHLVKVHDGADIQELNDWMSWFDPNGLMTPPPANFTFMGGTQEMPAGSTTYISTILKPGNYVLIAEVPDPMTKGMLVEFSIPN